MAQVQHFFDTETSTLSYIVYDPTSRDAVVIDPVLNYDPAASKTSQTSLTALKAFIQQNDLRPHFVLETHAHADHLSSSQVLKTLFPNLKLGIGANIRLVQKEFAPIFAMPADFKCDGSQFDVLFEDGQKVRAGTLEFEVLFTPGHTPACVSYVFHGTGAFVGDTLFMPDYGTGRCDFPGASAKTLYHSIHDRLYKLPEQLKLFTGHDYMPGGRALRYECSVAEHKTNNIHLKAETTEASFVAFRQERDKTLSVPKLLLPSVQININAGHLPEPDAQGRRFLKIPIY